ncbi:ribosomal protein S18 acetylase RimI-like enzyme [Actinomadura pelletieri DSM 43383]|uniref:Ribosomal protein S18 acetylase RimI-like enzyme n=1 Tax=Actinomadura pelletieri DSM 43383 TaxID=1120940 RepID=A0A495QLY9_9ACTN|nr:GNAT family N-acetyltransferase [Actinomadura pelletieri]RKS73587.1 ribosomal protein S18 acetylase RimI-like enzyme [Actinomadura pelletieri DSM 43383]
MTPPATPHDHVGSEAVRIRPLTAGDLPAAERAMAVTFLEADRLSRRWNDPEPQPPDAAASRRWIDFVGHLLSADPGGCQVAEEAGDIVGFAFSQNRGRVWYLATYGVLPDRQGRGIGRRLMDAVLAHADGRQGLFSATTHPAATRRYRLAGFTLHPQMRMVGRVDRSTLPAIDGLRDGRPDDLEWMDRLDTSLRGAGHGPDHLHMLDTLRLVVSDTRDRRGYVYLDPHRDRPALLAAENVPTAETLLWEALAATRGETLVNCVTTANHWAVDVGLAARLDLDQEGYLALRGMPEPAPYLASGHYL